MCVLMKLVMVLVLLLMETDGEQLPDAEDVDSAADRVFEPRLSRSCDEEVERLRDNWQELLAVAERVYMELIREKRGIYEQELDKQVKVSTSVGSRAAYGLSQVSELGQGQYLGWIKVSIWVG